jgi:hypothetical protein
MSDLLEDTKQDELLETTNNGDHDKFAHYVLDENLTNALISGEPVIALCGKVWTPAKFGDAARDTVCPECKEIFDALPE